MQKLIRITTVPISLKTLLRGQHKFMSAHYEVIGVSSAGKELNDVATHEHIRTIAVEMTRKISPLQDLKSLLKLRNLLKKEKPLIVHTHTPKAGIIGMLAAKLAGVPNRFHTVAGLPLLEATGKKRQLLNAVEKLTYSFATRVYPNSYGLRDIILEQQFCSPKKLKVLANGSSNGIDTTHFDPQLYSPEQNAALREKLGIAANDFAFIFVGRLVKDKGINELVAAFKDLCKIKKEVKLILVGNYEAELDPILPATLSEISNNKNIVFTNYQPDVRPFLAIADALVFPSYREGFPNVVLQAGAMGLPAIVSDINGCNEIIIPEKNGLIIPVKNQNAIFAAMQRLLDDGQLLAKMREQSRPSITSAYEQHLVWAALLEEYQSVEPQQYH